MQKKLHLATSRNIFIQFNTDCVCFAIGHCPPIENESLTKDFWTHLCTNKIAVSLNGWFIVIIIYYLILLLWSTSKIAPSERL